MLQWGRAQWMHPLLAQGTCHYISVLSYTEVGLGEPLHLAARTCLFSKLAQLTQEQQSLGRTVVFFRAGMGKGQCRTKCLVVQLVGELKGLSLPWQDHKHDYCLRNPGQASGFSAERGNPRYGPDLLSWSTNTTRSGYSYSEGVLCTKRSRKIAETVHFGIYFTGLRLLWKPMSIVLRLSA